MTAPESERPHWSDALLRAPLTNLDVVVEPPKRCQLVTWFGATQEMRCGALGTHRVRVGCRHEHVKVDGWLCDACLKTALGSHLLCGTCKRSEDPHDCPTLVEEMEDA
jgi:hypothetical protein